jgi:hypothetical protein
MNGPKPPQPDGQPEQVEELEREIERLQAENEGLKKKIEGLEEELRASKRQAAPFSKGRRKANPKRPGRKVGQGIFRHRPAPAEAIGGEIVEAAVPAGCPSCGGALAVEGEEWATTTDLPGSTPTPSHPLPDALSRSLRCWPDPPFLAARTEREAPWEAPRWAGIVASNFKQFSPIAATCCWTTRTQRTVGDANPGSFVCSD